jgi:hypothetical protein
MGAAPLPAKGFNDKKTGKTMPWLSGYNQEGGRSKGGSSELKSGAGVKGEGKGDVGEEEELTVYSLTHGYRIPVRLLENEEDAAGGGGGSTSSNAYEGSTYDRVLRSLQLDNQGEAAAALRSAQGPHGKMKRAAAMAAQAADNAPQGVLLTDAAHQWAAAESRAAAQQWAPLKFSGGVGDNSHESDDEGLMRHQEEDVSATAGADAAAAATAAAEAQPFRVVLFDDLRPIFDLMIAHPDLELETPAGRRRLLRHFLRLLGLAFPRANPLCSSSSSSDSSGSGSNANDLNAAGILPLLAASNDVRWLMSATFDQPELAGLTSGELSPANAAGVAVAAAAAAARESDPLQPTISQWAAVPSTGVNTVASALTRLVSKVGAAASGEGFAESGRRQALNAIACAGAGAVATVPLLGDKKKWEWAQGALACATADMSLGSEVNDVSYSQRPSLLADYDADGGEFLVQVQVLQIQLLAGSVVDSSNGVVNSTAAAAARTKAQELIRRASNASSSSSSAEVPSAASESSNKGRSSGEDVQLRLWAAYAALEDTLGESATARRVLHRTLNAATAANAASATDATSAAALAAGPATGNAARLPSPGLVSVYMSALRASLGLPWGSLFRAPSADVDAYNTGIGTNSSSVSASMRRLNDSFSGISAPDPVEALDLLVSLATGELFEPSAAQAKKAKKAKKSRSKVSSSDDQRSTSSSVRVLAPLPPTTLLRVRAGFQRLINANAAASSSVHASTSGNGTNTSNGGDGSAGSGSTGVASHESIHSSHDSQLLDAAPHLVSVLCLVAWFEYLANGRSTAAADAAFESAHATLAKTYGVESPPELESSSEGFGGGDDKNSSSSSGDISTSRSARFQVELRAELAKREAAAVVPESGIYVNLKQGGEWSAAGAVGAAALARARAELHLWHLLAPRAAAAAAAAAASAESCLPAESSPGKALRLALLGGLRQCPQEPGLMSALCLVEASSGGFGGDAILAAQLASGFGVGRPRSALLASNATRSGVDSSPPSGSAATEIASSAAAGSTSVISGSGSGGSPSPLGWLFALLVDLLRWRRDMEHAVEDHMNRYAPPPVLLETGSPSSSLSQTSTMMPAAAASGAARSGEDRLRHTFRSAIAALATLGRAPPLLWRLYARFEAGTGHWGAARRVLLRGLANCPASKILLVDAAGLNNAEIGSTGYDEEGGEGAAGTAQLKQQLPEGLSRRGLRRAFEGKELEEILRGAEETGLGFRMDFSPEE